jgi:hypothetical protein
MENKDGAKLVLKCLEDFTYCDYKQITNKNYWVNETIAEISVRQGCFGILCLFGLSLAALSLVIRSATFAANSLSITLIFFLLFVVIDGYFSTINYKKSSCLELELSFKEKEFAQKICSQLKLLDKLNRQDIEDTIKIVRVSVDKLAKKEQESKEIYFYIMVFIIIGIIILLLGFSKISFVLPMLGWIILIAKFISEWLFNNSSFVKYIHWISILEETKIIVANLPE